MPELYSTCHRSNALSATNIYILFKSYTSKLLQAPEFVKEYFCSSSTGTARGPRLTSLSTMYGCRPRLDDRAKGGSALPRAIPGNNGRPARGGRRQSRARSPHPKET